MKDTRRKTVNPATGRRVYITGVLGKRIRKEKKANKKAMKPKDKCKKSTIKPNSKTNSNVDRNNVKKSDVSHKKQDKKHDKRDDKKNDKKDDKKVKDMIHSMPEGPTPAMTGKKHVQFLLSIETTNTAPQQGMLLNRLEAPDSQITNITHTDIDYYDKKKDALISLTDDELKRPGFIGDSITFHSIWTNKDDEVVAQTKRTFTNTKGYFTIQQMVDNIVKFELLDRPKTCWFGGVDCHHVYFEGISKNEDNKTYGIHWGS